jgi:hypothetical protein
VRSRNCRPIIAGVDDVALSACFAWALSVAFQPGNLSKSTSSGQLICTFGVCKGHRKAEPCLDVDLVGDAGVGRRPCYAGSCVLHVARRTNPTPLPSQCRIVPRLSHADPKCLVVLKGLKDNAKATWSDPPTLRVHPPR